MDSPTLASSYYDKMNFVAKGMGIQGSGWSILAWDTVGSRLVIVQLFDQQSNIALGLIPIVTLDMWEHAFYLDYVNVKADYIKAWWNVVNWADATARLSRARTQGAGLIITV